MQRPPGDQTGDTANLRVLAEFLQMEEKWWKCRMRMGLVRPNSWQKTSNLLFCTSQTDAWHHAAHCSGVIRLRETFRSVRRTYL